MGAPAARKTDSTVCPIPQHVKGALSGGSADVIIGGQAAARVGDQAGCPGAAAGAGAMGAAKAGGSPFAAADCDSAKDRKGGGGGGGGGGADVVMMGSGSVLINGMPAARLGDQMAHGGKIVTGFPGVMIGG
ncbi:PAAR domain-containing protein [Sulfidibacter corallicola]|uniref:PAAR domain-containing protein n=1 Tax=Sulfidibacter corallicola TaxID=2818388 RepID=A0A8A4TGR2_SULCO|nr:PAAR domain-containing protein [Sulfidibacter corallicola]QTD48362.1 PAAR domain-containing protein [Sulfidibacter corallicola]